MNFFRIQASQNSRPYRLTSFAPLLSACVLFSACSLISGNENYVIQVDSVAVSPPIVVTGAVRTIYFGDLHGSCARLDKVERQQLSADTLQIRFIALRGGGNCIQAPSLLRYVDSLPNSPARTVHLTVQQPSGAPLRYEIVLPLMPAK